MFFHIKEDRVALGSTDMDYIRFGRGEKTLIMIPGLGDGLRTVRGSAAGLAFSYPNFARNYTVYVFSRKNKLPDGCTTRDMAADQAEAMKSLGMKKAYILGVSQGGMIAQHLAADYPELVEKLVLAVTAASPNELSRNVLSHWLDLAREGKYKEILIDTAEHSYSPHRLRWYRMLYPFLGSIARPQDPKRFYLQALSCLTHDASVSLEKIICPALILGGEQDSIVGADASRELAESINESELYLYPSLGHGLYEEARDFQSRIINFLNR